MQLAKISVERPIMITMGLSVFLIFGIIAYFTLNLNLQPDVEIPYITVSTVYPGAGPKEIEVLISKKIEESISTISQIRNMDSYSLDGVSIIIIEFKMGKDVDVANQEVKDKIDIILNDLPEDAKTPIVQKVDFKSFPVVDVVLSGNLDARQLYQLADKKLKDRFSQIPGVANVNISGGQEREIRVVMDNKTVYENSISLPQLLQILKVHNMDIPGGYFKIDNQEYTVRLEGEIDSPENLKELQVPTAYGPKKLRQFAAVIDGGKDVRQRAVYFDNEANLRYENVVRLGIVKSAEGNVVKVAEAIKKAIPELEKELPEGTTLKIVNDESDFVKSSVDDTMSNVYLGVIFTGIILLIFLHDLRSTIIVALSMPTSILSTFFLLKAWGLSLNMMTLMGLSVSVGVLVANSIVVIENIFRYKSMGKGNRESAFKGTSEVVIAVLASTLTNLVVFIPIANMSSMVGMWLREFALAAVFATIFSLIMSFTITPMLAALILPEKPKEKNRLARKIEEMEEKSTRLYTRMLEWVLRSKRTSWMITGLTFIIFLIVMMVFAPRIGFEFLPPMDDGKLRLEVELPEGSNIDQTADILQRIENKIKHIKGVTHILTDMGKKNELDIGTNMASMIVQLVPAAQREYDISEMRDIFVRELSDIPNSTIKVDLASNSGGPGAPVEFYLLGQNLEKLEDLKNQIVEKVKDVPGLINFDNSSRAGKPELTIFPRREKLTEAGVSVMDLALTLRSSVEGIVSSKYREEGEEYDITVTLQDQSVDSPDKIGNISVMSPVAGSMRLAQLADIKYTIGYTRIIHRDKYTAISFTGSNGAGVPLGNVTAEIEKRMKDIKFPPGYSFKWGGSVEMMNDMVADMMFAFLLAALLTYMLMAAMLESFGQPLLIMMTIVLGMIGVILSLYFTGVSFGITSMMSIVMLIGIVVNNAILLLDYANQLRKEQGYSPKQALLEAGPVKLKPQIMSTAALILGMLPMAMGIGDAGKEMRIPMGIVAIGGLIAATILTVFVIPALYYVTARVKKTKHVPAELPAVS